MSALSCAFQNGTPAQPNARELGSSASVRDLTASLSEMTKNATARAAAAGGGTAARAAVMLAAASRAQWMVRPKTSGDAAP